MNQDFPAGEWSVPIDLAREPDLEIGQLRIQPSLCAIRHENATHSVEPRVMQALVALAQRRGAVVSRDELVQRCWNGRVVSEDAINRCIAKVRKLAELDDCRSFSVETIARVGYRLIETELPNAYMATESLVVAGPVSSPTTRKHGTKWQWAAASVGVAAILGVAAFYAGPPVPPGRSGNLVRFGGVASPVVAGANDLPPGASFSDCAIGCPEMIVVPPGYLLMGSPSNESARPASNEISSGDDESPQHEVLIRRPFALGKFDVTREEYAHFVSATNRADAGRCYTLARAGLFVETRGANWRRPGFAQTDRDPVICISWGDAVAYTQWLTRRTGKPYRLPSEAEWEYAARAGSSGPRPGDGTPGASCRAFNGADADYHVVYPGDPLFEADCHDGFADTSPVGHFPPNAFGLFDIQGNAAQWTADCYHRTYDGVPTDGSAWIGPNCVSRVARGGVWAVDSRSIRFARRGAGDPDARFSTNGFRVARSL